MSLRDKINTMLNEESSERWECFWEELNSDENKDYRRGFKAGILCATLQFKSNLVDLEDGSTE